MNHKQEPQQPVVALLADPATYGVAAVECIETHAARVFLAGNRAYKIKRAVRFPFLDYSSLAKRKAACEAELRVNRNFAPDIYRRVVPITRAASGALALDGGGEPVEWAVEMRRFDERNTLDHIADRAELDAALADALGRLVASAHAVAPVIDAGAWIAALATYIAQNEAAFREMPHLFAQDAVTRLTQSAIAALSRVRPLLAERGRAGLVHSGHGDLHLGNIALIDGRPLLFDAIEFDPTIAAGDVFYDLAFLLMDLVERGMKPAANIVFNRYLTETQRASDLDALAALPLFLSLRAAIRAKVTAARLDDAGADRPSLEKTARTYFDLACRLIAPPPPKLIAVGGLSGTGKSVLSRALAPGLAPEPGAVILRSDVERKVMFGVSENERLPSDAYRPDVSENIYGRLADKAGRAAAAGHSVIVDAVFAKPDERSAIAGVAAASGVQFIGLYLSADLAMRLARAGARTADASDADAEIARQQEAFDLGAIDWNMVDASGAPEQTLSRAHDLIGRN